MVEVVSEIGINWDGDFELLRDMINKSKHLREQPAIITQKRIDC